MSAAGAAAPQAGSPGADRGRSIEWQDMDLRKYLLWSPLTFFGLRLLQHPANVIKTRYQMQQRNSLFPSPWSTAVFTLRSEGVRGLYRGFATSCLMLGVQQIYTVTYEYLRSGDRYRNLPVQPTEAARNALAAATSVFFVQILANPLDVVTQRLMLQGQLRSNLPMTQPPPPSKAASVGPVAVGTAAVAPSVQPVQAASKAAPSAPVTSAGLSLGSGGMRLTDANAVAAGHAPRPVPHLLTAREIALAGLRTHGIRGFYSGFFVSNVQFIPSAALFWSLYPTIRDAVLRTAQSIQTRWGAPVPPHVQADAPFKSIGDIGEQSAGDGFRVAATAPVLGSAAAGSGSSGTAVLHQQPSTVLRASAEVFAGGLASATVSIVMCPVDIVRTRSQVEGSAALTVLRALVAQEGWRALWKGATARMAMLVPQGALSVGAYELVKRLSSRDGASCAGSDEEGVQPSPSTAVPSTSASAGPSSSSGVLHALRGIATDAGSLPGPLRDDEIAIPRHASAAGAAVASSTISATAVDAGIFASEAAASGAAELCSFELDGVQERPGPTALR